MSEFQKVKMLGTEKGSPDGINVRTYEKDKTYDLPKSLADVFLNGMECCEFVRDELLEELTDEELTAAEAEVEPAEPQKPKKPATCAKNK